MDQLTKWFVWCAFRPDTSERYKFRVPIVSICCLNKVYDTATEANFLNNGTVSKTSSQYIVIEE